MQSEYPYHPLKHMDTLRIQSASGIPLPRYLQPTYTPSRAHSSITYSTSISLEIGHYLEGAGKTVIPISTTSHSFHTTPYPPTFWL